MMREKSYIFVAMGAKACISSSKTITLKAFMTSFKALLSHQNPKPKASQPLIINLALLEKNTSQPQKRGILKSSFSSTTSTALRVFGLMKQ